MKRSLPAFVIILLLFASCSSKEMLENKVWKLVNVNSGSTAAFFNHMGDMANMNSYNQFMRFYKDGTYTAKIGDIFDYGTWSIAGKVLTIHPDDNALMKFTITKLSNEVLILNIDKLQQLDEKLEFQFEAKPAIENKVDDAYSLQNNKWQIKANHKESDVEILNRVKGHVLCQLLYIEKAIENNEETISIGQFASPIKFYGNGLGLKPLKDVPDEWKKTFFDEEDLNKAYSFMEKGFQIRISVPDSKNRFLMYKGIFQQLYVNLGKTSL